VWLVNDCFVGLPQRHKEERIYLDPAIVCKLDTVIRNELMDLAVLVAFALCVADEDDHLHGCVNEAQQGMAVETNARFAHGGFWYPKIA